MAGDDHSGGRQTVHLRHLEVHEDDVGQQLVNELDGFTTVGGLPDDLHLLDAGEIAREGLPHDRMIVSDNDSN